MTVRWVSQILRSVDWTRGQIKPLSSFKTVGPTVFIRSPALGLVAVAVLLGLLVLAPHFWALALAGARVAAVVDGPSTSHVSTRQRRWSAHKSVGSLQTARLKSAQRVAEQGVRRGCKRLGGSPTNREPAWKRLQSVS